jgi:hypothetical protein
MFCILLCVTINGITRTDNTTEGTDINKQCKFVLQHHIILFPHDMFQLYRAIIRCFTCRKLLSTETLCLIILCLNIKLKCELHIGYYYLLIKLN